ncbi:sulfotransferase [Streptomyces pseudovenezuelae]|uniref:sulfotransferase n=1 Tax=Streptomyces pseudovenezuelae TaxID=67350 RepID=UPI003724B14D
MSRTARLRPRPPPLGHHAAPADAARAPGNRPAAGDPVRAARLFRLPAYSERLRFGDLGDSGNQARLAAWITGREETRFHELGLDAGLVAERVEDGPPTLGSALGITLGAYAERHGKVHWGDKRPAYALHVEEILRLFADARFVHLERDGRDCVASLLELPWWHRGFHAAVATNPDCDSGNSAPT